MKTFVYCNQKGGVGKSTFAVHHALYLKDTVRVLFLDLDSQSNSSSTLIHHSRGTFEAKALYAANLDVNAIGFTLFKGGADLNDVERMQHSALHTFKKNMQDLSSHFDVCIIDTPPTLGLRLMSAMLVGHFVICPFELAGYSIQGLSQMLNTVHGVKKRYNSDLRLLGFLANRVNSRSTSQREAMVDLCTAFSSHIIQRKMVNRIAIQEAVDAGCAVWDLKTSGAKIASNEMIEIIQTIEEMATKEGHL